MACHSSLAKAAKCVSLSVIFVPFFRRKFGEVWKYLDSFLYLLIQGIGASVCTLFICRLICVLNKRIHQIIGALSNEELPIFLESIIGGIKPDIIIIHDFFKEHLCKALEMYISFFRHRSTFH